jgi:protein-disulfide isomerase/uncharacterized membrane protein
MGKASRKKQQPEAAPVAWADPPAWSVWLLTVASALGVAAAAVSTWVHHQVTSGGGGYTSFCNLTTTVNCDDVVTSRYGSIAGVPVSVWAVGFYALLFALARRVAGRASAARDQARADALAAAVAGTLFSAYLATISLFVLQKICLLCAGLYVVSVLALVGAFAAARPLGESLARIRSRWDRLRRRPLLVGSAAAVVVGLFFASSWLGAATPLTREQVFRADRKFYDWYTSQPIVDVPPVGGQAEGPEKAPIQLVEWSDFECPHCGQAYASLKDVLPRFSDQVRFVYHHYPLSSQCNDAIPQRGHEHACQAAVAAECAGDQGRFRQFANVLVANQSTLDAASLEKYAKEAGLDLAAFRKCLADGAAAARVADDVKLGQRVAVKSTPTFFLNGRRLEGNMTFQNWLYAFAIELDKS